MYPTRRRKASIPRCVSVVLKLRIFGRIGDTDARIIVKVSSQQIELRDESGLGACHGSTQMANDVRNVRTSCCNQIEIGAAKLLILRDELRMFMSVLFLLA